MIRTCCLATLAFIALSFTSNGDISKEAFREAFGKLFKASEKNFEGIRGETGPTVTIPGTDRNKVEKDENDILRYEGVYECEGKKDQAIAYFKRLVQLTDEEVPGEYEKTGAPSGDILKKKSWEHGGGSFSDVAKNPTVTAKVKETKEGNYEAIYVVQEPVFKQGE